MSRAHGARFVLYDEAAGLYADNLPPTGRDSIDPAQPRITARRAALIRQVSYRFGVTLYPHPRHPHVVVVSETDYETLRAAIMTDPLLNAVGRGYYSYLGGELTVTKAPDWTCDPLSVAVARIKVLLVYRPLKPIVRALTRLLSPRAPKGTSHA